jgi:hypothetical protein
VQLSELARRIPLFAITESGTPEQAHASFGGVDDEGARFDVSLKLRDEDEGNTNEVELRGALWRERCGSICVLRCVSHR